MIFIRGIGDERRLTDRIKCLTDNLHRSCIEREYDKEITISIGAVLTVEEDDFMNLYIAADKALYKSKDRGKNCFTILER